MSGNVSNHVWVEDSSRPLGGYWVREKGLYDGSPVVTTKEGTGQPTKNRYIHPDATPAEATNRALFQAHENVTVFWVTPKPDTEYAGTGASDNAVIATIPVYGAESVTIHNDSAGAGVIDVQGSTDGGTTYVAALGLVLQLTGAYDASNEIAQNEVVVITDKFTHIRLLQKGATATSAKAHVQFDFKRMPDANMVADAIDYTAGTSLLGFTGGASLDSQIIPLEYGVRNGPFYCTGHLSALDFSVPVNSEMKVEAQ